MREGEKKFVSMVCGSLKDEWCSSDTVEEKWKVTKTALCESAGHVLGYAWRKKPDWFSDSETELKLLFAERNRLIPCGLVPGWRETGARSAAKRAVRIAKVAWFQREGHRGRKREILKRQRNSQSR